MSHHLIDPRSDLVFDTREWGRRAGANQQVQTEASAPEGIGNDVMGVPAGSPLRLELMLEAVGEGILVTGTAEAQLAGECARCLSAIEASAEVDVQELFLFPGKEPDDAEASRVEGERIDLEPVVRDAVVLDLPFIPLCRDDCAGLCPTCGADLNKSPDHRPHEEADPRWAGLAGWGDRSTSSALSSPDQGE